ncbi:hypothetical protein [Halobacillus salinus]|uniref:Uncharacterized protein n=1 Tax=Halobacillus salinus TaxID=192814 RepID=A0A4Z0H3I1_9BACI|nr:hypothetical protein [Halobacillus salinus]TGB04968.1 hypothetical protein E4663_08235 [Halobacillus salinus]
MPGGILFSIVFVSTALFFSFHIKLWVRFMLAVYYGVVFYLFTKGYSKLVEERAQHVDKYGYDFGSTEDVRMLQQFWGEKAAFVDRYSCLVIVPIFVFLIYSYSKWMKRTDNSFLKVLVFLTSIPVGLVGLYFWITFTMLGYQP